MKLLILTHFFNEELLIGDWLHRHLPISDQIVMVNDHSTDSSLEIIKEVAPEAIVLNTRRIEFDCFQLDAEMMEIESQYSSDYKLILNTTEFLEPNFKTYLERVDKVFNHNSAPYAIPINSLITVSKDRGFFDVDQKIRRKRYVHNHITGCYALGRHDTSLMKANCNPLWLEWRGWYNYPECKQRKMQIAPRIPQAHKDAKLGYEHLMSSEEMDQSFLEMDARSYNLLEDSLYRERFIIQ